MKNKIKRFFNRLKLKFYIWSKRSSVLYQLIKMKSYHMKRRVLKYVLK